MQQNTNLNWSLVAAGLAVLIAAVSFAIQLGSVQTHVEINGGRLTILEAEMKMLQKDLSRSLQMQQDGTDRTK